MENQKYHTNFFGSESIGLKISKTCPIIALWRLENFVRLFEIQSDQKSNFYLEVELLKNDPKTEFFEKMFDKTSAGEHGDSFQTSQESGESRLIL